LFLLYLSFLHLTWSWCPFFFFKSFWHLGYNSDSPSSYLSFSSYSLASVSSPEMLKQQDFLYSCTPWVI
jgi:hypothetical protein